MTNGSSKRIESVEIIRSPAIELSHQLVDVRHAVEPSIAGCVIESMEQETMTAQENPTVIEMLNYLRDIAKSDNPPMWRLAEIVRVIESSLATNFGPNDN